MGNSWATQTCKTLGWTSAAKRPKWCVCDRCVCVLRSETVSCASTIVVIYMYVYIYICRNCILFSIGPRLGEVIHVTFAWIESTLVCCVHNVFFVLCDCVSPHAHKSCVPSAFCVEKHGFQQLFSMRRFLGVTSSRNGNPMICQNGKSILSTFVSCF